MGFTPREVDQMRLWEFHACAEAYAYANGGGEAESEAPSAEALDAAILRFAGT